MAGQIQWSDPWPLKVKMIKTGSRNLAGGFEPGINGILMLVMNDLEMTGQEESRHN